MERTFRSKRIIRTLLFASNIFLVFLGWIMAFYVYARLPQQIPFWLNFFGQDVIKGTKSPLFFLYPLIQTLFFLGFWLLAVVGSSRKAIFEGAPVLSTESQSVLYSDLRKEHVYLSLIFFNLIFIHIQRSLILLAHQAEKGVMELYFYSLFGILLVLILLYRFREKILKMLQKLDR